MTREDRENQLKAFLRTYQGQDHIIVLYQKLVARPDREERPAMTPAEMIPLLLSKEFADNSQDAEQA